MIYQEILELVQCSFYNHCSKLDEHYKMISYIKTVFYRTYKDLNFCIF